MVTRTIRLISVSGRIDTVDGEGNPISVRNVTFRVVEWPDLGPWDISIPVGYTRAQAKAAIEAEVQRLATNVHEWYGFEWTLTI